MKIKKLLNFDKKEFDMAETVQIHLPSEMAPIFEDIRKVRSANCEPTTNKAIVIDAVKKMHSEVVPATKG